MGKDGDGARRQRLDQPPDRPRPRTGGPRVASRRGRCRWHDAAADGRTRRRQDGIAGRGGGDGRNRRVRGDPGRRGGVRDGRQLRRPAPARRPAVRRSAPSPAFQPAGAGGRARPWLRPGSGTPGGAERIAGTVPPGGSARPAAHRHRRLALAGPRQRRRRRVRRPPAAGQPDRAARCHPARRRRVLRTRRVAGVRGRPALAGRCDGPAGPPVRPSADPCPPARRRRGARQSPGVARVRRVGRRPPRQRSTARHRDLRDEPGSADAVRRQDRAAPRADAAPAPAGRARRLGRPGCPGGGERAGRTR